MEALINWIKLPKTLAWPLVVVSGLLLWGSEGFKEGLGLQPFIEEFRMWVGVAFLFFLTVGLQPIVPFAYKTITERIKEKKEKEEERLKKTEVEKQSEENIKNLTEKEKEIMRYFLYFDSRSQDLSIQNGHVSKLTQMGFIYRAALVSYGGRKGSFTFPHNISDWAWKYIRNHPSVLEPNQSE